MKPSRKLFTDGWNSFWHLFFGIIAVRFSLLIPIFVAYQLFDYKDVNLLIDIAEFIIGFIIGILSLFLLGINICWEYEDLNI